MANECNNVESTSYTFTAKDLSAAERIQIFQVFITHRNKDPIIASVTKLPYSQVSMLLGMMTVKVQVTFEQVAANLQRMNLLVRRENLYRQLLLLGAPKKMLYRYFAKSRREIEYDRRLAGIQAAHTGRPRAISTKLAYEIVGHWDRLKGEEQDFATRLIQIHERYPETTVASLYRLLADL